MEHYRKAVRLNPNAIEARESLASGLLNQGEMAEAEQHFRTLLTLAPERNENDLNLERSWREAVVFTKQPKF